MKKEQITLINELARHNTSHLAHFILTTLTVGIWGLVWLLTAWSNSSAREEIMKEILALEDD